MLSARAGAFVLRRIDRTPWTNVYGVGRTLIALATLGVVIANDPRHLFLDHGAAGNARSCSGVATLSLFCHTPAHDMRVAQLLAIVVLIAAAVGWRPRWTCIPHWWITFSVAVSAVVEDGGDQAATILLLLLIPAALGDGRRWIWSEARPASESSDARRLLAFAAMLAIRIQVAAIYLQAFTAKLAVTEWRHGTAVAYYLSNPYVGAPHWLTPALDLIVHSYAGIWLFTYGTLAIELLLCVCLVLPRRITHRVLWVGIALHVLIGVLMGLPSFSIVMFGALVLDLRDWSAPFALPRLRTPALARVGRTPTARPAFVGPPRKRKAAARR
jgi:antimicrobial peptide system SdpB family protein